MVNKALWLENHRGVIEHKRKLVRQHQSGSSSRPHVTTSSAGPVFHPAHPQCPPRPQAAGHGFSTLQRQVISAPTISRLMLLGIRVFRGPKLPKTNSKLIIGATTMVKRDIMPTDAPIHALMLICPL
jgi:hypothetical protein